MLVVMSKGFAFGSSEGNASLLAGLWALQLRPEPVVGGLLLRIGFSGAV